MPKPRRLPPGTRSKQTKRKTPQHHRPDTAKQAAAGRANLVAARASLSRMPRTSAQKAASRANLAKARAVPHKPSAKQVAVQKAWAAKGEAAWKRGEAVWVAKGKAAWSAGAALWAARGRAAWARHRNTSGSVRLHSLKASVGRLHPLDTHIEQSPLVRRFARPHLIYMPHRFYREISTGSSANAATISSWHRSRHHRFRTHVYLRRMRRHSIGHWRRTRKRIHPY